MLDIEEEKEWESEHLEELGTCVRVTRRRTRSVAIVHEWFERLRRFGEFARDGRIGRVVGTRVMVSLCEQGKPT